MKLLSMHVENFGNLHNLDLEFQEGLNTILKENGWGKSTVAAFIRVMFYGFQNERGRDVVKNERLHFTPWQGGVYGGSIRFECEEKRYRLGRTFQKKNDGFYLYDDETNLPSHDFSENIGEEIFNIDRDSFSKTIFIAQQDAPTEVTSQISAKIGNVDNDVSDMSSYEPAMKQLHDKENELSPKRSTGLAARQENEINDIRRLLLSKSTLESSSVELGKKQKSTKSFVEEKVKQRMKIVALRDQLGAYNAILAEKKQYEGICNERKSAERAYQEENVYFPRGVPGEDELENAIKEASSIGGLKNTIGESTLTSEQEQQLSALKTKFSKGVPTDSDIENINQKISKVKELESEMRKSTLSSTEKERLDRLKEKFSKEVPDERNVEGLIESWKKKTSIESALPVKKASLETQKMQYRQRIENQRLERQSSGKSIGTILLLIGIVLVAIGIIGSFVLKMPAIIVAAALGIIFIVLAFVKKKSGEKIPGSEDPFESMPAELSALEETVKKEEADVSQIKSNAEAFFREYALPFDEDSILEKLYHLKEDLSDYQKLTKQYEVYKSNHYDEQLEGLYDELTEFFEGYGVIFDPEKYQNDFQVLLLDAKDYIRLLQIHKRHENAKLDLNIVNNKIIQFLQRYGFTPKSSFLPQLNEIRDKVVSLREKEEQLAIRIQNQKEFEEKHDIKKFTDAIAPETNQSMDELTSSIRSLDFEISTAASELKAYDKQQEDYDSRLEEMSDAESRLSELTESYQQTKKLYSIVMKTQQYLQSAKDNFLKHYMAPMQKAFNNYFEMLTGYEDDSYVLDANLNVTKKEKGINYDIRLLSDGYKDLVGICRRMAMVDAMYEKEKPFLIFDDTFVNLDDDKVEDGLKLLNKISRQYQVIYFTCHGSRV